MLATLAVSKEYLEYRIYAECLKMGKNKTLTTLPERSYGTALLDNLTNFYIIKLIPAGDDIRECEPASGVSPWN